MSENAYLELKDGSLLTYHASGKYQDKTDFDTLDPPNNMAANYTINFTGSN